MNKRPTFKIVIDPKANKEKRYQLKLRVTYNGKPTLINTPFTAAKIDLRQTKIPSLREGSNLKREVDAYIKMLQEITRRIPLEEFDGKTPGQIIKYIEQVKSKKEYTSDNAAYMDFFSYGRSIAERKKASTEKSYLNALTSFSKYVKKENLPICYITSSTIKGYERYLVDRLGGYTKTIPLYIGHLAKIHKTAREEFNAEEYGITPIKDPFQYFRPEKRATSRKVPSASRPLVQYLIDNMHTFKNDERRAAELFLLIFGLQGMNVADMMVAPAPENGVISFVRQKTKDSRLDSEEVKIKIHDCILPLYNRYRDPDGKLAFNLGKKYASLDYFHIQAGKWMKALRNRLAKEPKLAKEAMGLRYGSARHGYATISRSLGISKDIINDGLAHTDRAMAITDIYIEKDWEPIWKANLKMLKTFKWDPLKECFLEEEK